MNSITRPAWNATKSWQLILLPMWATVMGCGDPIRDALVTQSTTASFASLESTDGEFGDWPLSANGYRVQKPSPLSFVRSFPAKINCPDRNEADLVPWDKSQLTDSFHICLKHAFREPPTSPDVLATIARSELASDQAFDVSRDGTRLVTLSNRQSLVLYDMSTGERLGERRLADEITGQSAPVTAIRFCGEGNDILMASSSAVFRLSSDTGDISARTSKELGTIAQWRVTPDESLMAMRNDNGDVFLGRPDLSSIQNVLLPDGVPSRQIAVMESGKALASITETTTHYTTVDGITPGSWREIGGANSSVKNLTSGIVRGRTPRRAIGMGTSTVLVADDVTLSFEYDGRSGERESSDVASHWHPTWISHCGRSVTRRDNFLMVGRRIGSSTDASVPPEWVLFRMEPVMRTSSIPLTLPTEPVRVSHDLDAGYLAMLYESELQICHRAPFWHAQPPSKFVVFQMLQAKDMATMDSACRAVRSQTRFGYGLSPAELETALLEALTEYWTYFEFRAGQGDEEATEMIQLLDNWVETGSEVALTASAIRHNRNAWAQRGSGSAGTVRPNGWKNYESLNQIGLDQCTAALESESPPLAAYEYWIRCKLELGGQLEQIDEMCRKATTQYPGEVAPHESVSFKLAPRWFGEAGDPASHGRSVAKLFSRPADSQLYVRLLGGVAAYTDRDADAEWSSYDRRLMTEGIRNAILSGRHPSPNEWLAFGLVADHLRDPELAEKWLRHLVHTTPVITMEMQARASALRMPSYQPMLNRMWRGAR